MMSNLPPVKRTVEISTTREIYGIQILRALAAVAVVCHHTLEVSNGAAGRFSPDWITTAGAAGVDIFFVISGFIMLHVSFPADRSPQSPGVFLLKRIARIYPLYWLCCLGILSLYNFGFLKSHKYNIEDILNSSLLLPGSNIIGVSWTLVYEVYFYIIFASLLMLRKEILCVAGVFLIIILLYAVSDLFHKRNISIFLSNPIAFEFCFGLSVGYLYKINNRYSYNWPIGLKASISGLMTLIVAPLLIDSPDTTGLPAESRVFFWGIPATIVVAGFLSVRLPKNFIGQMLILLGNSSYSLYLTHIFVMIGYGRLIKIDQFNHLSQAMIVPIIVIISVMTGVLVHLFIEAPVNRRFQSLFHYYQGRQIRKE